MKEGAQGRIAKLLVSAAHGDQEAWREIVGEFSPRIFGLLRSQCGNADLAEELTQSVFVTLAEKLSGYLEEGHFEAWIFRVAVNRLRDEMRRRARHAKPTANEHLSEIAAPAEGDSGYRTADLDQVQMLERAMGGLSRADREIVDLRHTAELSFKEISALLDEPVGTLLARHHRALARLRESIEREQKSRGSSCN